ncbi:MAG TPA: hypothetical protein VF026_30585 [Ktedonobacteraceae bacterium]
MPGVSGEPCSQLLGALHPEYEREDIARFHPLHKWLGNPFARDDSNARAGLLDPRQEWKHEQRGPELVVAELRTRLGVGVYAGRIIICGSSDDARSKDAYESLLSFLHFRPRFLQCSEKSIELSLRFALLAFFFIFFISGLWALLPVIVWRELHLGALGYRLLLGSLVWVLCWAQPCCRRSNARFPSSISR